MPYTKEDALAELRRVHVLLGRYPSYEDTRKHSTISPPVIRRLLGPNWLDVKRHLGFIPMMERPAPPMPSDADGGWLTGIIDGEGCLRVSHPRTAHRAYQPVFCMTTRADDVAMLTEFCRICHMDFPIRTDPRGYPSDTPNAKPKKTLWIENLPSLKFFLIPVLEKYGLRSKKRYELPVFKFACEILWDKRENRMNLAYDKDEVSLLDACFHTLSDMKKYNSDKRLILEQYGIDDYVQLPE